MKLTQVPYADEFRQGRQTKFYGLNHTAYAQNGEIFDMKNLCADHFPVLAARQPRRLYKQLTKPHGIFHWGYLAWVDGTDFYFGDTVKGQVADTDKLFCGIGNTILIWPDKKFYNVETNEFGSLEAEWSGGSLTFTNGLRHGVAAEANTVKCTGVAWADYFKAGDAVGISGCTTHAENNKTAIIREIDGDKLYFSEWCFKLGGTGGDEEYTETGTMKLERTVPALTHICQCDNRVWGCDNSSIYCSKLGDPFNWNVFDGVDTDAWACLCGDKNAFTACSSALGTPIFFKQNKIVRVSGTRPSNYATSEVEAQGVYFNAGKSLACAGGELLYLGREGFTGYSGSRPYDRGEELGTVQFDRAVAGSDGRRYYVSARSYPDGNWTLYVYDSETNLWHKEDNLQLVDACSVGGNMLLLAADGKLWIVKDNPDLPDFTSAEGAVSWEAEFADITEDLQQRKTVAKFFLRLELEAGASVTLKIKYDSEGNWINVGNAISTAGKRTVCLPVVPRRCDHYRLKLTGTGGCKVYEISRQFAKGSDSQEQ